ncbi:MAG TPA: hypothetical protein VNO26_07670 [Candidatus Limnocylindria bacterium]|nr:hypothetical protein [Candidatus Limnocylindria bacterium]
MPARPHDATDRVIRSRLREPVNFADLTEHRTMRLTAIQHYTARAHFAPWHRVLGRPDFAGLTGLFSPLVYVELDVHEVPLELASKVAVIGETHLARTVDASGATRQLVREGRHRVETLDGRLVARARLVNVFTRYDPDPARRRVTAFPPETGLGIPQRTTSFPTVDALVPAHGPPVDTETDTHVWHFGQTDPNRHVNGVEYLRVMETYLADVLARRGGDLARLYAARARMVYRKPCFRGEGYRRAAYFAGEAPLALVGAFYKAGDEAAARPAAVVEVTYRQHDGTM